MRQPQRKGIDLSTDRPSVLIADAVRVFGGAERFVLDAAQGLRRRGWDVTVLAYPDTPLHRRALKAGLDTHTARTRANGAPWTVLPLAAWFARRRFDAVLSVYDKDLRTAAWAARMARPRTAILHSRECDAPLKDRPWIRWFHRHVADRILVNSEATARTTLRSAPWLDASRLRVVPKGIDLERFRLADRAAPTRDGPVIGFAGQLIPRKRVDRLIEAVARLDTQPVLRIAGDGPEREALERLARARGVEASFEGRLDDLSAWYREIDVFVLPSLIEGWGYVIAEAAASGCAVLAFAASSVPEVVPDSAGSILVGPSDDLLPALAGLLEEGPEGWRERGRRLRLHAERSLGLDRMLDDLENELLSLIGERRTLPRPAATE